jgi:hypothetical protein
VLENDVARHCEHECQRTRLSYSVQKGPQRQDCQLFCGISLPEYVAIVNAVAVRSSGSTKPP